MALEYQTERLALQVFRKSDGEKVLDYYQRNRDFLEEWDPHRPFGFYTLNYQEQMLEKEYKLYEEKSMIKLWISPKEDLSKTIGFVVFNNIIRGCFLSCHLGYKLDKDYINHGYVTEAVKKGIDIMFGEYGLHRIEANIMPKNKRSIRVVEKLGFYHEGLALKYLNIHGQWEDHIHYVLLNDKLE